MALKFELEEYHRNISDEELLADLKRVTSELEKSSVTYNEYKKRGRYSSRTFLKRFGSWNKALERAGLNKNRDWNIPEENIFQNLEEVWIKLGRQPRYSEMQKPLSKYSTRSYLNRFGTWRKALENFVEYVNNKETSSLEGAIQNLGAEPSTGHKTMRNINWRLRFRVMRRDNFKCKICGRSPASDPKIELQVDHIKPWAKGGETVIENLQTLCSQCNIGKSDLD